MTHEYSVQIHAWISKKLDKVKQEIKIASDQKDVEKENYYNGQLQELSDMRKYLSDKVDLDTHQYYG